jgi:poly-gamma-glutamate capsule biosynthesis protein CapA/YwtB (metallophosphatase superfamily)
MSGALTLALAGDTMLGRSVARAIAEGRGPLLDPDVVALAGTADLFVLNLECCISDRGELWPAPGKPFFFRAPPQAAELLAAWGVDCVSLANNHALDYGRDALLDTLAHLDAVGVAHVGAGPDADAARAPARVAGVTFAAATDHPPDFAAGPGRPGVAYANLRRGLPDWLRAAATGAVCLVHWGPNMVGAPIPPVRRAARELEDAGAALVAGHSAHVPHGAAGRVLFDLGDFLDDYAVHAELRNDLGLLFLVRLTTGRIEVEAVPLALDFCHTRLADAAEAAPLVNRFVAACADLGTDADVVGGRIRLVTDST